MPKYIKIINIKVLVDNNYQYFLIVNNYKICYNYNELGEKYGKISRN